MKIAHVVMQIGHSGIRVITLSKQGRFIAPIKGLFLKGRFKSMNVSSLEI